MHRPIPLPHSGPRHRAGSLPSSLSPPRNGDRTILLSNGQREIQTPGFTRREYPDGAVRTVYCTGSQETRSASGTVSIRCQPGIVVLARRRQASLKTQCYV